jgi:glycosyltransferase involved in cell wall biosynthesis
MTALTLTPERRPARRHRVALYNGVFVRHDAISDSLGHKLTILAALADAGVPVHPVVFTHDSDSPDPAVHPGRHVFDVLASPEFRGSDLHWYEFGIAYGLFNTVFAVPPGRPVLAVYHNVTPLELVTDPDSRQAVQRSLVQRHNLEVADHVACVSPLNRDDLVALGMAPERLSVLPLPPAVAPRLEGRPFQAQRHAGEPVQLLFVGRFVRAKGLIDLVEAAAALLQRGVDGFHLTLVGNPAFADPPTRTELDGLHRRHGLRRHVSIVGRAEHDQLAELYASTDALVLPSYHEGYCVPVIEALGRGCYVIASTAGNLPAVAGGLGTLVAPGDVAALADAIEGFVGAVRAARTEGAPARLATDWGPLPEDQWRDRVLTHLEGHSLSHYRRGVLDLLARYLPDLAEHPAWPDAVAHLIGAA